MAVRRALKSWFSKLAVKYGLTELARRFAQAADVWESDSPAADGVDISMPYAQSVWVHGCVSLIADNMARVPFVIARADDPRRTPITSGPLYDLVLRPNRYQNWDTFVIATMTSLLLDGMLGWERYGMQGNRPREVFVRELRKLTPDVQRDEFGDEYAPRWFRAGNNEPLTVNDEIFIWKLYNPYSDIYGLAPISPAALAIYADRATGVYEKAFFRNGARPGIVFTAKDIVADRITQEQCDTARDFYASAYGGAKNQHKPFFTNAFEPHEIGYTFADLGIPDLKRLSKSEILAIFHVPETLLGAQQQGGGVQIGGSNRKSDEENFILNTVMTWAEKFSWWFDHVIAAPFGNYVGFYDFRQVPILQDRLLERAKEGREWCKMGATYNDVNDKFNLGFESQPWGNEFWVPANMLPARLLMNGPIAAAPVKDERDPADRKDAKKTLRLLGEAA